MYANIFIIVLDLAIVSIQYANLFQIQVVFKGAVYSVKLLIEFFVLNRLMDAVGLGVNFQDRTNNMARGSKKYISNNAKFSMNNQESNIPIGGNHPGFEDVSLQAFPSNAYTATAGQQRKIFGPSAPVISADRSRALPADPSKIHVFQTLECTTTAPTIHPSHEDSKSLTIISSSKAKCSSPCSSSSSELDFATRGY